MNNKCSNCTTQTTLLMDVGSDSWDGGKSQQHIEECTNPECGQWRLVTDIYNLEDDTHWRWLGKWDTDRAKLKRMLKRAGL